MRSSRISIFSTNIEGSRNEEILAPLILTLESGDPEILLKVLQELFAYAQLNVLSGFEALLLERLNIGGNVDTTDLTLNRRCRLIEPPFGDEPVTFQSCLK